MSASGSPFHNLSHPSRPIPHKGGPLLPEQPSSISVANRHPGDSKQSFSKVFRYRLPDGQLTEPSTVEIAGSFTHWHKLSLIRDGKLDAWHVTVHHIPGNRTHHYMLFLDGQPCYDKTCDGLVAPDGALEERFQLQTIKGARVLMLFAQTR